MVNINVPMVLRMHHWFEMFSCVAQDTHQLQFHHDIALGFLSGSCKQRSTWNCKAAISFARSFASAIVQQLQIRVSSAVSPQGSLRS